jgi:hypothetical protein
VEDPSGAWITKGAEESGGWIVAGRWTATGGGGAWVLHPAARIAQTAYRRKVGPKKLAFIHLVRVTIEVFSFEWP